MLGDDAAALGLNRGAGGAGKLSDDRLRTLARDLIAQVEERGAKPAVREDGPSAAAKPAAIHDESTADTSATPAPAQEDRSPVARRSVFSSRAPLGRMRLEAPSGPVPPVAMTLPQGQQAERRKAPIHSPAEVRRLIEEGLDGGRPAQEHPSVIALTLLDRAPLEQAAALRLLPRGQVRSVHRALRVLEAMAAE